jgi:Leucine-rich repeat (LRR) protein
LRADSVCHANRVNFLHSAHLENGMNNVLSLTAHFFRTLFGIYLGLSLFAASHAVIPTAERTALQALYTSTNGASWANNTNWNGAVGTECTWFGVTCNAGDLNVTIIQLNSNGLTGSLPALADLTALSVFRVQGNSLSGSIPALSALSALQDFNASVNALTGSIPSLAGLSSLIEFNVTSNNLSGSIPSFAGLAILMRFRAGGNQLTGALPALTGSPSLTTFNVANNQLTGSIPSLTGLTSLQEIQLQNNQLSGSIPSLSGLVALGTFYAFNNQLTGSIPALTGLGQLDEFDVSTNQLTGSIPSLAGLNDLDLFRVANNQLTGVVPAAPPGLDAGDSTLCPNFLTPSGSAAWDIATGSTPWSAQCTAAMTFTVTPSAGANGAISPATPQTVLQGGSFTFETIPNSGFAVSTVGISSGTCNLGNIAPNQHLVSNVQSDCTFSATFALAPANFTVTPSIISGNGTVTPATPQTVASGGTISFTFIPSAGFILGGLQGSCSGSLVNNVFTTDPIAADCTVGAVFAPDRNAQAITVPTLGHWSLALLGALAALLGVARAGASRRLSIFHRHRN